MCSVNIMGAAVMGVDTLNIARASVYASESHDTVGLLTHCEMVSEYR